MLSTLTLLFLIFPFFIGLAFLGYKQLKVLIKVRGCSPKILFKDFRQKMWMTVGLGGVFFSLYFILVLVGSWLIDQQMGVQLFFLAYEQPIYLIYAGLFLFAFISLLIYLTRMIIIHLYLRQNRK